jgi:TolB-like protein
MGNTSKVMAILAVALFIAMVNVASAGEVVTPETREWANSALKSEKSIQAASGRNTLVVLYFGNKTGKADLDPLQKGLTLMLITDLSAIKELQLLERIKLQALVEELGLGSAGLVAPEGMPRVGRLLGARWLVGGDITLPRSESLTVMSKTLDVPSSSIAGQAQAEGALQDLLQMEKSLVFQIVKQLKIEVTPDVEKALKKPCSTNMTALFALFKGVDASDRADYEKAAEFYETALKADPAICFAFNALDELKKMGKYTPSGTKVMKKKSLDTLGSLSERTSQTNQLSPNDVNSREMKPIKVEKSTSPVNININFR